MELKLWLLKTAYKSTIYVSCEIQIILWLLMSEVQLYLSIDHNCWDKDLVNTMIPVNGCMFCYLVAECFQFLYLHTVSVWCIYSLYSLLQPCDPAISVYPIGWESYWWVLVAFAIFIFVCCLILIFIICVLYKQ